MRIPYPLQWGAPTFDAGDAFGVMAAAFAALVEVQAVSIPGFYCTYIFLGSDCCNNCQLCWHRLHSLV